MAKQQIPLRLDDTMAEVLRLRAAIENRSMNEIVTDALDAYAKSHPIARENLLKMARMIAKEDAGLLQALADA